MARYEFCARAVEHGWLSERQAENWAAGNSIPPQLAQELPPGRGRMKGFGQPKFNRQGQIVTAFMTAYNITDQEMDDFFGIV